MSFAGGWMDIETNILSQVSHKERQMPYDITYMWNLKYDINEFIYKREINFRHGEQTCCWQGGGGREGWIGSLRLVDANYYI